MKINIKCGQCDYKVTLIIDDEEDDYITDILNIDCIYCGEVIKYRLPKGKEKLKPLPKDNFDINNLMNMFGMKK